MTLIIYVKCKDAIIVISDRKESDTSNAGQITKKYYLPTNNDFLLALSGDSIRIDTIVSELHIDQSITASSIRNRLHEIVEKSPKIGSPESQSDGLLLIRESSDFKFYEVWFTTNSKSITSIDPPFKCYGDGAQLGDYLIRKFDFSTLSWEDASQYLIAIMQDVSKRVDSVGSIEDYGFDVIVIKDGNVSSNTINESNINYKIDCFFKPDESLKSLIKIRTPEKKKLKDSSKVEKTKTNTSSVNTNEATYNVNYTISNGTVLSINSDKEATSLICELESTDNGELTISIPRALLDSKIGGYDEEFFVLLDGEEANFDETTSSEIRTLTIAFPKGAEEIEIIGTKITGIETMNLEQASEQISPKEYVEKMHKHATEHNLPIVVQTDKSRYMYNSDIIVTIINPYFVPDSYITLEIFNEKNQQVYKKNILVNEKAKGIYQDVVEVQGKYWVKPGSKFRVVANYNQKSAQLDIFTTEFGASVELDKKVYAWTDKVYITIVAPDLVRDPSKIESIGDKEDSKIKIATSKGILENYKLTETAPSTGIFTGEVTLTGFSGHDCKGDGPTPDVSGVTSGSGPIDGFIETSESDGLVVTLVTPTKTMSGSALIRWNIGEIKWLSNSYPENGKGEIRIVDPDMNLNPNKIDEFKIKVWSDSDPVGIYIKVIETGKATGIFKGFVNFTSKGESTTDKLNALEGDTITAEYVDRTLPEPYTKKDYLTITSTSKIGTLLPSVDKKENYSKERSPLVVEKIKEKKEIFTKPLVRITQGTSVPGCEERDECYIPSKLTIRVNETVIWKNEDTAGHTITSGTPDQGYDGNFDSGLFLAGKSYAMKFTKKGVYPYSCILHPWQTGVIIVE